MKYNYHLQHPAREAPGEAMPFVDWRYVQAGRISWIRGHESYSYDKDAVIDPRYRHTPYGISIRALPAQKREIDLIDRPRESYGVGAAGHATCNFLTIMHDGAKYRGWYNALSRDQIEDASKRDPNFAAYICYAESEDGVD